MTTDNSYLIQYGKMNFTLPNSFLEQFGARSTRIHEVLNLDSARQSARTEIEFSRFHTKDPFSGLKPKVPSDQDLDEAYDKMLEADRFLS